MRAFNQWLNGIAFVLATLLWQSSGLSMEQVCSFWHGPGYIGDPNDCQGWGFCNNNKLAGHGYCPEGHFHDYQSGLCMLANKVHCAPLDWQHCAQRETTGDYIAEPFDCRKYKRCDDDAGDEIVSTCPDGHMFSNRLQTCVSSAGGCPQNSLDFCAYMPSGATLGDPLNCGLYLECHNGSGFVGICTAGRYYNYMTGNCQTVQPEHCGENVFKVEKKLPPATDANVCAKFYQSDRSGNQFISDALTCHGYYSCSSQYAIGHWKSCPQGTHFQWFTQKCVTPDTYSCPFDRCNNLNATFVATINSGCTEYVFCKNQTSHKVIKCPDDYPYFDERTGVCVDTFPNYTVCFMDN